ncbi:MULTISPECIES: rhamnose ABC transporter substrate-binding protein [unclassified Frigoribacterium]|uniref:rhamnose ABC transporter substrate-binding protein n=1 Tax=unclassified Frigoribacterium TaxID=2627005 RepID=UPI000F48E07F|nr:MULTISPECIES: rhamnose ABC transporter substrate-binding protein [unclassified Frigoribacterium]ROP78796.1 monosaccharide ABC transporter substrate-binding protein (CUT2 family) [Frigoribacterium sp. PhB107]TDT62656.1 monosaccharide ABC transporter substrate-binding protein (CUT2 family) [Frigoribacterium sp. PhB116]
MEFPTYTRGRTLRRAAAAVAALATVTLVASGCALTAASDDASSGSGSGGTESIAFVPKQLNNPYTDVVLGGGESASKAIGYDYSVVGPLEASASSQVTFLNTLTQQGTNVIVIAANDPDAVGPALKEARDGGAKIVAFDSDTNPDYRDVFVSQVEAKDVALIQIRQMSEQIGGQGDIAILSATANATNQNEWIKYIQEEVDTNPDYAGITIVSTVYGDDDDAKSFQEAQGLLQANPDLKGIISPTTVGIAATARYLSTSEYKGKVALTGLGLPNEMREFVKDGTVTAFALWDPAQLGEVAAYAGQALVDGTITGEEGDTFTAGDLGERTVGADGIVIVGPPTEFDADNIDDYDF